MGGHSVAPQQIQGGATQPGCAAMAGQAEEKDRREEGPQHGPLALSRWLLLAGIERFLVKEVKTLDRSMGKDWLAVR